MDHGGTLRVVGGTSRGTEGRRVGSEGSRRPPREECPFGSIRSEVHFWEITKGDKNLVLGFSVVREGSEKEEDGVEDPQGSGGTSVKREGQGRPTLDTKRDRTRKQSSGGITPEGTGG